MKILMSGPIAANKALPVSTAKAAQDAAKEKARLYAEAAEETSRKNIVRQQNCARLSFEAYRDKLGDPHKPLQEQGLFIDTPLNLLALARVIDGEAYLAFRGTVGPFGMSVNWWKVNLRAGRVGTPVRHCGFQEAWLALKPQVMRWLETHRPTTLHITGHSMGAAMGQLAALDLCNDWPIAQVVLFATPMVGSPAYNDSYSQAVVTSTARPLRETTQRYLLLSDAISIPLPRLLGYEPSLPIFCIDGRGQRAGRVAGFTEQAFDQITGEVRTPPFGYAIRSDLNPGDAYLGEPTWIEQAMPTVRLFALSYGAWIGWVVMVGIAFANVMSRALGFHSMEGYARALHALPPINPYVINSQPGRTP